MKLSVVIPVFNTEAYLRECLESVVGQTVFGEMELILVDDGSTDASPAICDEYAERYANIRVLHKQHGGVSAARNAGLDAARGAFVGFVDSDDRVYPEMYRLLYEAAEKTGAEMAFCRFEHPFPEKDVLISYPFENGVLLDKDYIKDTVAPFMLADSSFNSLCNKLFSRRVLEQNGLRLPRGKKHGEDRELVLRFLLACTGICGVDYTGYFYRNVPTSAVQRPRYDYADTIFEQYALDRALFARLGVERALFDRLSAVSVAGQLICALSFANNKLRGKDRRRVMRAVTQNAETQRLVSDHYRLLTTQNTRFNALIIGGIKRKSVAGIRLIMLLMKLRVKIHALTKGRRTSP